MEFLRSVLNGAAREWPADLDAADFLANTRKQGVQPLLLHTAQQFSWPAAVRQELLRAAGLEELRDVAVQRELPRVLQSLSGAGVHPVLLKGTPLAFWLYPARGLRPRADTDLLIDHAAIEAVDRALSTLGYTTANSITGKLIMHQRAYAGPIALDVHWKVLNPAMFAGLLTMEDLRAKAVAVPMLGPHALAAGAVHSLLLACVHRVAHHGPDHSDRLIWLYDIHLLLQQMDEAAFQEFAQLAALLKVRSVCLAGIRAAQLWFPTNAFERLIHNVLDVPEAAAEPTARYLQPGLNRLDLLKLDAQHLSGLSRWRLLREHLFPPAGYMLRKYNTSRRLLLPALYLHRAVAGAWKSASNPRRLK